jgi:hypothetical protein
MFGRVFGGATAYPKAKGIWRDDERNGVLVNDEPVVVHCYTTPAARRDHQAEPLAKQRGDFPQRQPELFVQDHGERDGRRPQLRARGTDRSRRLERVAALHARPQSAHRPMAMSNDRTTGRTSGRSS